MLVMRRALEWAGWVGAPVGAPSPPFPTQPAIMPGPGGGGKVGCLACLLACFPSGKGRTWGGGDECLRGSEGEPPSFGASAAGGGGGLLKEAGRKGGITRPWYLNRENRAAPSAPAACNLMMLKQKKALKWVGGWKVPCSETLALAVAFTDTQCSSGLRRGNWWWPGSRRLTLILPPPPPSEGVGLPTWPFQHLPSLKHDKAKG